MLYAIIGEDGPDSLPKRTAVRPSHTEYLQPLIELGKVIFAGCHPAIDSPDPGPAGFTGSLIIAEFDSLEAAHDWAARDPYALEGVFRDVVVKPLIQAFP